jgi:hypothetical protein
VSGKCIKSQGSGMRNAVIPKLKENVLRSFGYALAKTDATRHSVLDKAIKEKGKLDVLRHLVAIRTLNSGRADKTNFNKLDVDVKYIQEKYFDTNVSKSSKRSKKGSKKTSKRKGSKKRTTRMLVDKNL